MSEEKGKRAWGLANHHSEPFSHRHDPPMQQSTGAVRFSTKKRTTAPTCCGVKYTPRPSLWVSRFCHLARVTLSRLYIMNLWELINPLYKAIGIVGWEKKSWFWVELLGVGEK